MIEKTIALPSRDQGRGKVTASESGATFLSGSFSALLKIAPSHPVVLLWVASICLKLKRARRAYEVLSRVSASDWERRARPERLTRAAVSIARLGYPGESERLLRLALAVAPNLVPALLALAAMLVESKCQIESQTAPTHDGGGEHWREAEDLLRRAVAADPNFSASHLMGRLTKAAASIARPGCRVESEDLLRLALAVAPELVPALLALVAILVERARQIESQSAVTRENGRAHWREAEHLLRRAVAADPNLSAPRLALAAFLLERLRYVEALGVAAEGVRCFPSSLDLRLVLARIQFQLRRYADAAKTIEALLAVAPEHAWAWYELGKTARNSYERLGLADIPLKRAAELAEKDAGLLAAVAQNFLYDLNFVMATECYERLLQVEPAIRTNFVVCRQHAICLNACGRTAEAADMIAAGLESCRALAAASKDGAWQVLKREESLLLWEARRFEEADAALRSIREASAGTPPCYDRSEYLPGTRERVQHLSEIVGSRDVFVMAQGPSFAQFAERMQEFADFDFVIATLNSFPPIENELSKRLGRTADLLLLTHPGSIQSWHGEFEAFLDRPSQNLVAITRYALSALQEFGINEDEFVARHDDRFLLAVADGGAPLPARPLHFESGSTLSLLIPLLLFGRPRRIFLFGADAGANPDCCKRPYFFYHDYDSVLPPQPFLRRRDMVSFGGQPEQLREAHRRFYINAVNADRIMAAALRTLDIVFGISAPPIFNVCPHSSHELFPRIDIDMALQELASGGRSEPRRTQHTFTKVIPCAADSCNTLSQ
jgi:tetratricopeptide (TPR) repeat protein